MDKPWKYVDNQFLVSTRTSYRKALKLSNWHDSNLNTLQATEPALVPLYNRYHPLHTAYVAAYSLWGSAKGTQEGQTQNVKELLKQALLDLDVWDVQIQVVHAKGTVRYKELFPDGRLPFNQGTLETRINAFDALSDAIGAEVALAAVKVLVDATYTALDTARDTQSGAKGGRKVKSGAVEAARVAIMDMQYRDMAVVLDAFYTDRETMCKALFDLETLRNPEQTTFTANLAAAEVRTMATRTLLPDDMIRAKVTGPGPLKLYLATTEGGNDSTAIDLATDEEKTFPASDFGITDYSTHRHLTAHNGSGAATRLTVTL